MQKVLSIEEIKARSIITIAIPGFDNGEVLYIEVKKPNLMAMMAKGKIPNPLLGVISKMMSGKAPGKSDYDLKEMSKMFEFYCDICMVNPTYEEMQDIITDDQVTAIFDWAIGGVQAILPFREKKEDGPSNNDGEPLRQLAE